MLWHGCLATLLRHSSPLVRSRAIKLFSIHPDPTTLEELTLMLQDENHEVQAEAISAACAIFKGDAIPVVRPYLESPDPYVKRRAAECLLRHGDAVITDVALNSFREMVEDNTGQGEQGRVEAGRLVGEVYDPEFSTHLSRLIREDESYRWFMRRWLLQVWGNMLGSLEMLPFVSAVRLRKPELVRP